MNVGLYIGDICQAPAELICTSTNPNLNLMIGTGGLPMLNGCWNSRFAASKCDASPKNGSRHDPPH
jgi:hypothetical protein